MAGIVVITLFFNTFINAWTGPSLERSRKAYNRGDWAQSEVIAGRLLEHNPDDTDALCLRARSLARLGRGREAIALDARLGADRLTAEDLFLIGRELMQEGRTVLGTAALNAATKLDPKHRETIDALAALVRRVGTPGATIGQADRLVAVPTGEALAELIVGLATIVTSDQTPGNLEPILARVLRHDRAMFLRIDSPAAARKVMARLLLEEGRNDEARIWLDKVKARDDPERNWLLSRVLLDRGEVGLAKDALTRAGSFGLDDWLTFEPARYVGASRCAECHTAIYRAQQTSPHAQTLAWGDKLKSVPLPKESVKDPEDPDVVHSFARSGDQVRVRAEVGGKSVGARIDYALGSGRHGMTMLARDDSGRHRSLRISYYAGGDYWGLTSGFEPHPSSPERFIGEPLSEESFRNCLNCHSTRFSSEEDRKGPEAADKGIACERCHGPGERHLRAVETNFPQLAIARPKLATPSQRMTVCAQCHGPDGVIPPSDPRFIRFYSATLPYSRCVTESGGRLDCVACHDPHRNLETDRAYYDARCLACHGGGKATASLRLEAVPASACALNQKGDCVKCHMPKIENIMPFMKFTDHQIRIPRPPTTSQQGRNQP